MLVETVLGNAVDPQWAAQLAAARVDHLDLDQWEAQKHRVRKRTRGGAEVALVRGLGERLRDGDVLSWDPQAGTALVARIRLSEVLVIDLAGLARLPEPRRLAAAVALGHAVGNQHWPAVVHGGRVYVPVSVDRKVMDSVLRTHGMDGVAHEFRPGAEVLVALGPDEARRLFGGAGPVGHSHAPTVTP
jgi:urease accessory protein